MVLTMLLVVLLVACGGEASESESFTSAMTVEDSADAEIAKAVAESTALSLAQEGEAAFASEESEDSVGEAGGDGSSTGFFQTSPLAEDAQTGVRPQNRVIVRTVDMGIIVPDVPSTADEVVAMAARAGGWQVSSDRSQKHHATVSVRVPAEVLDNFVLSIRKMADSVEFETSSSRDVTDEYVDNEARLSGLRATEERLLEFLAQSAKVDDALKVQAELTRIQLEIEGIQGRLRFLSQTSAFSLVNLSLTTIPGVMKVEIGPDSATYRAGLSAGFRATFQPPDGVDEFTFTWDFGDGTEPLQGSRTAPTTEAGERVTSTVSHAFSDVEQSPYIVQLNIRGIGDAGLFLGSDTLIAIVTEIPGIEVFAGEDRVVDEGDGEEHSGSFTRPEELWDFKYRWDFGDGSATVLDVPAEGETRAFADHTFRDYRPEAYRVTLTVTAQSEAGEVKGSSSFFVQVNDVEGFIVGGWDVGGTAKSAIRALTAVAQVLLIVLIWLAILSPVWLAVFALVILFPRLRRRFGGGDNPTLRFLRGGGQVTRDVESPQESGRDEIAATPQADPDSSSPAFEEPGPGAVVCHQCGRAIPGGNPPKYCPFCGAETDPSEC